MTLRRRLFEAVTGRPYLTGRTASEEFGPPLGARYTEALRHYTDAELIAEHDQIMARLRAYDQAVNDLLTAAADHTDTEPDRQEATR